MNHQNDINHPSSSSYYNFYQSEFQNPIPIPNFPPASNASAPPDPSIYDYTSAYNPTLHNPDSTYSNHPNYDSNSWYHHQNQTAVSFGGATATAAATGDAGVYGYTSGNSGRQAESSSVMFDDYGRPITSNDRLGGGTEVHKNDIFDQGVYPYSGGGSSVGNGRSSRAPVLQFDDYGRPISYGNDDGNERRGGSVGSLDGGKVLKGVSKVETKEDVGSGVQKFRVVLLSEGGGSPGDMDVLCQIGLDGIQILDPATSRTLKVYSLDTVTKWEVLDSNIFAFWTKTSIDINARRVRLKSNSYTTTKILDMVAAASYQFKEMDGVTISEQQPAEKKKGFPDWINLMKPTNEEKDHWVPDEASTKCTACNTYFGAFVRRHHCRNCGDIFCDKCTQGRIALTAEENAPQVRVCDQCLAEVTQRLSHANEVAGRSSGFNRHEDLAKKLQEEMEKKRKTTTESKSNVPCQPKKEVECPTCTVHLQVEVPASGSKTIECSVCQHPFLVSAH